MAELNDKSEKFHHLLNNFPEKAQDMVAAIGNTLLEPDIRDQYDGDPQKVKKICNALIQDAGLSVEEASSVIEFFELPGNCED